MLASAAQHGPQQHNQQEQTHHLHDGREAPLPERPSAPPPLPIPSSFHTGDEKDKPLILSITCNLHNIRARVPLFTRDLSYVNNALVRPIVAYINSRHGAFIPVTCRVVKSQSEFDGSWTIFDSGLLEDLSREVYAAVARDVEDTDKRKGRMRKVGWWGVQVVAQAPFYWVGWAVGLRSVYMGRARCLGGIRYLGLGRLEDGITSWGPSLGGGTDLR